MIPSVSNARALRSGYLALALAVLLGCGGGGSGETVPPAGGTPAYAIAIHGGAGSLPQDMPEERKAGYRESLEAALRLGQTMLDEGRPGLDVVEQVIRLMEDDPHFNAGRGAVFNHDRRHELDASIMDGQDLSCGAVAGVSTVKNPITLARAVMEHTRHVLLSGDGAERFADESGVERVPNDYFSTPARLESLERALERESALEDKGTVGVVVLDREGNLAAGTSTGGLTNKRFGRVGDSPIIGAGTYADNRTCAVSGTGTGEEYIRHSVAYSISALIEHRGLSAREAAERVVGQVLQPGDGGVIVVGRRGDIAQVFNTDTMLRGAADSSGRFEIAIWE